MRVQEENKIPAEEVVEKKPAEEVVEKKPVQDWCMIPLEEVEQL